MDTSKPSSVAVGASGKYSWRFFWNTARARIFLASAWGFTSPGCAMTPSMWPPSSAGLDSPQPEKGTWVTLKAATRISSSRFRWLEVPSPGLPTRSLPGLALAAATNSCTVFHGASAFTASSG